MLGADYLRGQLRYWVMRSDQRNAELVATTQARADALVRIGAAG